MEEQEQVGLVCSDADLVEYYVQLIASTARFSLKAIWCPDAERSIQLAADNDVPSVSHTAIQLISRADTHTVILTGNCGHTVLFCAQALASKKRVICVGAVAFSLWCAKILKDYCTRFAASSSMRVIYALRHSAPFALLRSHASNSIGQLHSVSVEAGFQTPASEHQRLVHDAQNTLHTHCHELLDAVSFICNGETPRRLSLTAVTRRSVVNHFRLKELMSASMQISFGSVVANVRVTASAVDSLLVRLRGDAGVVQLSAHAVTLERLDGSTALLWQGDGCVQSLLREGIAFALASADSAASECLPETVLVECLV